MHTYHGTSIHSEVRFTPEPVRHDGSSSLVRDIVLLSQRCSFLEGRSEWPSGRKTTRCDEVHRSPPYTPPPPPAEADCPTTSQVYIYISGGHTRHAKVKQLLEATFQLRGREAQANNPPRARQANTEGQKQRQICDHESSETSKGRFDSFSRGPKRQKLHTVVPGMGVGRIIPQTATAQQGRYTASRAPPNTCMLSLEDGKGPTQLSSVYIFDAKF